MGPERRTKPVTIRVTPKEYRAWCVAARASGKGVSEWVREKCGPETKGE